MASKLSYDRRILFLAASALSFCVPAAGQYMGAAPASPPRPASAPESAMHVDYDDVRIAPGDVISIATYGVPELTTTGQTTAGTIYGSVSGPVQGIKVGATGDVVLPYLGPVKLAGLTISEAAAYLKMALKDGGYLTDPQVAVGFVDSPTRAITVLGEVVKPAPVPAHGQIRLLDAISSCGGFTPMASHTITVKRNGSADPITVELGSDPRAAGTVNIPLLPGDTVIVSKVGSVFVLGQVKTPSAIPLAYNSPITVLRALAVAGGVNYGAGLSKARIIRTNADSQHVEILLDLKKIMYGKQQDVALHSDDVLFIPSNTFKASMAAGGVGVAVSAFYAAALLK
jgi:polysaccharide export outer membrane protein